MKTVEKYTFLSWTEPDPNIKGSFVHPIALVDYKGNFEAALNCPRNLVSVQKNELGIYDRLCRYDHINYDYVEHIRSATNAEINLYLKYVDINDEGFETIFIRSYDRSYVIYNQPKQAYWKVLIYKTLTFLGFIHK